MELSRWQSFSKHDQLLHIGSEIKRAAVWQGKDSGKFILALNQAMMLTDLTLKDPKWRDCKHFLVGLKNELQKFTSGQKIENIEYLYQAL